MKIVTLWILILSPVGIQSLFNRSVDLCPGINACSCYKDAKSGNDGPVSAICRNFRNKDFYKLALSNVSNLDLTFDEPTAAAAPVLESLRDAALRLKKLSVSGITMDSFKLEWLPDTTEVLTIARSGAHELVADNCEEETKRLKVLKKLYLTRIDDHINLTCVPNSLTTLLMTDMSLQRGIEWPRGLAHLKVTMASMEGDPRNIFQHVSRKLYSFWVNSFPIKGGSMPILPDSSNLTFVSFQYSNISHIDSDAFLHRNIKTINLGGNDLSVLNVTFPTTLRKLYLYWNHIAEVPPSEWAYLSLTVLDLRSNQLRSVPLGLPKTLELLSLQHNSIDSCPPEAFLHLTKLTRLDLSYNKIKIMPTGMQPGLIWYNIYSNLISLVPGPRAYSFCSLCEGFNFGSNRWFCDAKFFTFILWTMYKIPTSLDRRIVGQTRGRCTSLPEKAFSKQYLQEAGKYTDYITAAPFSNCSYEAREMLNCSYTNLQVFPKPPPDGLKKVIISGNRDLKVVPDFVFAKQSNLKWLLLEENGLKRIPYGLPVSLQGLSLSDNNITELSPRDVEALGNLTNIKELTLNDNHIKSLLSSDFTSLTSLSWLGMDNNDLVCDCSLHSFVVWYERLNPIEAGRRWLLPRYARCNNPPKIKERELMFLRLYYHYDLQCVPPVCEWDDAGLQPLLNCSRSTQTNPDKTFLFVHPEVVLGEVPAIPANAFWESIILVDLELEDGDVDLRHLSRLKHVDLSDNLLKRWPIEGLPPSLEDMILTRNVISHIPTLEEVKKYLPNLHTVDLRHNQITTLESHELRMLFSVSSFLLTGNPLVCNCSLTALVSWVKAEDNNALQDKTELVCFAPSRLDGVKLKDLSDEEFCQAGFVIDVKIWGSVVVFVILLALFVFLFLRVSGRRRYKAEILSGFQKLLQEEASFAIEVKTPEGKEIENNNVYDYEAFVATDENNQDGEFLDKLIQELEGKRKQRLCVSIRDFVPGMDVADNIVKSIRTSKRVILLMSKSFVDSPWCQYEVQVALAELHQRQRKLLIPIMLEDLTGHDATFSSIKTFISLIPTFKAPSKKASKREWEKFWNSVENLII